MLDLRVYRAAFAPAVLAAVITAFLATPKPVLADLKTALGGFLK